MSESLFKGQTVLWMLSNGGVLAARVVKPVPGSTTLLIEVDALRQGERRAQFYVNSSELKPYQLAP